ncbi:MAG: glycoside hydrolase family 20 zincin-like fold domain-containing protein, partial [Armatimonadota bacterium]
IEEHAVHDRAIFYGGRGLPGAVASEYVYRARDLLRSATGQVWRRRPNTDPKTQARILAGVLEGAQELLRMAHPTTGNTYGRLSVDGYKGEAARYVRTSQDYVKKCEDLGIKYLARQYRGTFRNTMSALGIKLPEVADEELIDTTRAELDQLLAQSLPEKRTIPAAPPKPVTVRYDAADEASKWLSDGTQVDLISPAEMATVTTPSGDGLRGVRIDALLSRLPTIPKGNITIHAGRFYAERVFDEAIDVTGGHFFDLHLHSSRDVPVTIYVDNLHSDFHLHAGEQIVRIDLRNFGTDERFDWTKWSKLERIGIDIWPQDNYYPFPETQDTEITLVSMTVSSPRRESPRGKGLWLSQFRSNIPHGVAVPRERYDELMQRQHYKHVGLDYGWKHLHEGFRTFTEHRAVSPIYGIVTSPNAGRAEQAAADELQRLLAKIAGVTLPITPADVRAEPSAGNVILLGEAAMAAGLVTDMELKYVGPEGFVINAHNGRIAIAGPDAAGTAHGVARYLEDHGVRFYVPDAPQTRTLRRGLLHELYTLERPFFRQRPVAGGWQLMAQRPTRGGGGGRGDAEAAARLAESIKDAARRGDRTVARSLITDAEKSPLSRYVAAKLLWDPFDDATRMIREFPSKNPA